VTIDKGIWEIWPGVEDVDGLRHYDARVRNEYMEFFESKQEAMEWVIEELSEKPQWIYAAERQPPDAWPRPCVCRDGAGSGTRMALRWWRDVKWWWGGQFRAEVADDVLYWLEVYPLPDGTEPE